jgi:hypothetical protein
MRRRILSFKIGLFPFKRRASKTLPVIVIKNAGSAGQSFEVALFTQKLQRR